MEETTLEQTGSIEFQFEIEDVFLAPGQGTAVSGLVELGLVTEGALIDIHGLHAKRHGRIGGILRDGDRLDQAEPGHHVTLLLEDLTPGHIATGMLATHKGGERRKELRERAPRDYAAA
jgi:translation elongation factor EF-Tu-like GTPase